MSGILRTERVAAYWQVGYEQMREAHIKRGTQRMLNIAAHAGYWMLLETTFADHSIPFDEHTINLAPYSFNQAQRKLLAEHNVHTIYVPDDVPAYTLICIRNRLEAGRNTLLNLLYGKAIELGVGNAQRDNILWNIGMLHVPQGGQEIPQGILEIMGGVGTQTGS